jgi:hypothetical protein
MMRRWVLAFGAVLAAGGAVAAPLDPEACAKLKTSVAELEGQGVRDVLMRGPGARRSLDAGQVAKVRQLMDLDGQVRFRCVGERPFVALREEPPEDPAEAAALKGTIDSSTPGITLPPGATVGEPKVAPIKPVRPAQPTATAATGSVAAKPKVKSATAEAKAPTSAAQKGATVTKPVAVPAQPAPAVAAQQPSSAPVAAAPPKTPRARTTAAPTETPGPPAPKTKSARTTPDDAYRPPAGNADADASGTTPRP